MHVFFALDLFVPVYVYSIFFCFATGIPFVFVKFPNRICRLECAPAQCTMYSSWTLSLELKLSTVHIFAFKCCCFAFCKWHQVDRPGNFDHRHTTLYSSTVSLPIVCSGKVLESIYKSIWTTNSAWIWRKLANFREKNSNLKKTDLLIGLFLFLFTSVTIFFHASNTIFTLFLPK